MPFCSNCGSQVTADQQFCPQCGAKLGSQTKGSPSPPPAGATPTTAATTSAPPFSVNQLVFAALGLMGLDALLTLVTFNPTGFIQNAIFIVVLYYYVYKKLEANDRANAKTALLYVGILYGVLSLIGASFFGIGVWTFFEFPAAILCLYAWSQITTPTKAAS